MTAESAPVYKEMNTSSEVLITLPHAAAVTVYFALQGTEGSWCKIAVQSERRNFGFVLCSQIHRGPMPSESGGAAAAPVNGAPAPECAKLVDELIEASGINASLAQLSKDFFPSVSAQTGSRAGSATARGYSGHHGKGL